MNNRCGQKRGVLESSRIFCEYFLQYYFMDLTEAFIFFFFPFWHSQIYIPQTQVYLFCYYGVFQWHFFLLSVTWIFAPS